jgi:Inhibitor of growth proteins N-terminal histone-binding
LLSSHHNDRRFIRPIRLYTKYPSITTLFLTAFLGLDNLPSELQHIYEELSTKERLYLKYKREKDARESLIFRHIRQHGGHSSNPFEDKYNPQIEEIFNKMEQLQEEKCILADRAKELVISFFNETNDRWTVM